MLNKRFLTVLGYDLSALGNSYTIVTASTIESAAQVTLSKIVVLGQQRLNFPLLGHDLPSALRVDGLLGLDFFRRRRLSVDFRQGFISLR